VLPEDGSVFSNIFLLVEIVLTVIFTLELAVNMLSKSENCFR